MSKYKTCPFCGGNLLDYSQPCPICGKTNIPNGYIPLTQGSYMQPMGTLPPEGTFPPPQADTPENSSAGGNIPFNPPIAGAYPPPPPGAYHPSQGAYPPSGAYPPPTPGAYPAIFDPLGGIDPNETINDIPVSDFATFIGKNSHYYIPKFYKMHKTGNKISWNWPSFFLGGYWYLFRRMIKVSVIVVIIGFIYSNLLNMSNIARYYYTITGSYLFENNDFLFNFYFNRSLGVQILIFILGFVPNIIFGLFSNWFYLNYCTEKIKQVRNISLDQHQYRLNLADKGRTRVSYPFILLGISFAIGFIATYILLFFFPELLHNYNNFLNVFPS